MIWNNDIFIIKMVANFFGNVDLHYWQKRQCNAFNILAWTNMLFIVSYSYMNYIIYYVDIEWVISVGGYDNKQWRLLLIFLSIINDILYKKFKIKMPFCNSFEYRLLMFLRIRCNLFYHSVWIVQFALKLFHDNRYRQWQP